MKVFLIPKKNFVVLFCYVVYQNTFGKHTVNAVDRFLVWCSLHEGRNVHHFKIKSGKQSIKSGKQNIKSGKQNIKLGKQNFLQNDGKMLKYQIIE